MKRCARDEVEQHVDDYTWVKMHLGRDCEIFKRQERLATARSFCDATFPMPTSVSNHGGYGLYAMRSFKKGKKLPFTYPGINGTEKDVDELNDYLVALCNEKCSDADPVAVLQTRWGVVVYDFESFYGTAKHPPHWDAIYDAFVAYRFGTRYWNIYSWCGGAHILPSTQTNAALFVNEPPPFARFVNRMTGNEQQSKPNIKAMDNKKGHVHFYAKCDIAEGDELLLNYGPFYNRNYKINPLNGPTIPKRAATVDDQSYLNAYTLAIKDYLPQGTLFCCEAYNRDQYRLELRAAYDEYIKTT